MARVIGRVQEASTEGKLAGMLLMDVKRVFNHVSRNCLLCTLKGISVDKNLMRWTQSFMSERVVCLVFDSY